MRIERLEAALCSLPLARPIRLGSIVYRSRDYVAIRLTTVDGAEGHAIGFSRGAPVAEGVVALADSVVGVSLDSPSEAIRAIRRAFAPGWPGLIRSASLIDIALWDIAAKTAGLSLGRLLGADRASIPVLAVAGYFGAERSVDSIVEEVGARAAAGYQRAKVVLVPHATGRDAMVLAELRSRLPPEFGLAVDAHAAWSSIDEALTACGPLDEFGLEFIEDPFVPQAWRMTRDLAGRLRTPLAAGEDVVGIEGFEDALSAAAVLRVDATSSGGVTYALEALEAASAIGKRVLPVVWAGLHAQLAAARPAATMIEMIPDDTGAELSWQLLAVPITVTKGSYLVPETPGAGLGLDWESVRRTATAMWSA